jgi:hypothetical protein
VEQNSTHEPNAHEPGQNRLRPGNRAPRTQRPLHGMQGPYGGHRTRPPPSCAPSVIGVPRRHVGRLWVADPRVCPCPDRRAAGSQGSERIRTTLLAAVPWFSRWLPGVSSGTNGEESWAIAEQMGGPLARRDVPARLPAKAAFRAFGRPSRCLPMNRRPAGELQCEPFAPRHHVGDRGSNGYKGCLAAALRGCLSVSREDTSMRR